MFDVNNKFWPLNVYTNSYMCWNDKQITNVTSNNKVMYRQEIRIKSIIIMIKKNKDNNK